MIARVSGYIIAKKPPLLTVETHGIGYEMYAPMTTFFQTPDVNHYVKLHTQLIIKDDEHQLYAFANQDERYIFQLLIRVNGIGPKVALAILSGLNIRMYSKARSFCTCKYTRYWSKNSSKTYARNCR
jgi:Holliday junction DNA helicase RuvA